jgi:UDP-glucuronate decarboxylase
MSQFLLQSDIDEIVARIHELKDEFAGKKILLTGGRGFLGRYFMSVFNQLNETFNKSNPSKLIVLDNLISSGVEGEKIPSFKNIEYIKHNVIEPFHYKEKFDFIIHAAGIASPFYYRAHPLETLDVAINGTRNMLDLANKDKAKIVFFSSSEIYCDPDPKHVPMQESYRGNVSCQGPRACYDESKRVGETLCYIYHNMHGTHTNTIRPFNVYGPGMQELDYRVMPNFASCIKGKKSLKIYGSGNQTRTFCYITDAIVGFISVIAKGVPGEAYNIGNPSPEISMAQLVNEIEKVIGNKLSKDLIEYPDSYPADEPNRRAPDIKKAKIQLNYNPEISLHEGLKRFLNWTDKNYSGNV